MKFIAILSLVVLGWASSTRGQEILVLRKDGEEILLRRTRELGESPRR